MSVNPIFLPAEAQPLTPHRQALLDAAAYISEHGWCQNTLRSGDKVCLLGALWETLGILDVSKHHLVASQAEQRLSSFFGWLNVTDWNDAPGRTVDEVIAALEMAAVA